MKHLFMALTGCGRDVSFSLGKVMRGRGNFILFFLFVLWCRVSGKVCVPEPGLVLHFTAAA